MVDGELVVLDDQGRANFHYLWRRRFGGGAGGTAAGRLTFMAFDLLDLDGRPTISLSYVERRALLEGLSLDGAAWRTPGYHVGDGHAFLEATQRQTSRVWWPSASTRPTAPECARQRG